MAYDLPSGGATTNDTNILTRTPDSLNALRDGSAIVGTGGGTANAQTVTTVLAFGSLTIGLRINYKPTVSNTGALTIALDGIAAADVKKIELGVVVPLVGADVVINVQADLIYSTQDTAFLLMNPNGKINKWAKGADIASAAALTLGDDGNYFDITGTTSITSIVTKGVGTVIRLHFDGVLILTHNATDLVLPGGLNITTVAGDELTFVEYATGDWRLVGGTRVPLASLVGYLEVNTNIDFGSISSQAFATQNITVTGAEMGDYVLVSSDVDLEAFNVILTAQMQSANTVRLRVCNFGSGAVNPANQNYRVRVIKREG